MLTGKDAYDLDSAIQKLESQELILKSAVDVQTTLQILVDKNIVTREEVEAHRERVRNLPKYKNALVYLEQTKKQVEYYKAHPEEHLRDLFNAKLNNKER